MRALLVLIPVVLASCGHNSTTARQRQILKQSKEEVALRESWAADAVVIIEETGPYSLHYWKVKAGALDRSDYPYYKGLYLVPGTERVLYFNREGCLAGYENVGRRCPSTQAPAASTSMLFDPLK